MLWIKRNMFLAVGGLVTLLLLGGGGFLLYSAMAKDKAAETEAEEVLKNKDRLHNMSPFPASSNIAAAKAQIEMMGTAKTKMGQFFRPIPFQSVSNVAFKKLLDETVADLQRQATRANTRLPKKAYAFSFEAEKEALSLPAVSFPTLPMQLAEVAFISKTLFEAKINGLESLKRPRMMSIGTQAQSQDDYHLLSPQTNAVTGTVTTPYEISLFGFSANLAQILDSFSKTEYGVIVKTVVTESTAAPTAPAETGLPTGAFPGGRRPFQPPLNRGIGNGGPAPQPPPGLPPPGQPPPGTRPPAAAAAAKPQTVLDENLLRISLLIYVIRPNAST